MTTLPRDSDNTPIPALRLTSNGAHQINATSISAKNTIAFNDDTRVISLYATAPVYIAFGDTNITATNTGHYFPSGLYYDIAIGGDKTVHTPYIAIMAAGSDGIIYISEKQ